MDFEKATYGMFLVFLGILWLLGILAFYGDSMMSMSHSFIYSTIASLLIFLGVYLIYTSKSSNKPKQTLTENDKTYILKEPIDSDRNIYCYKSGQQIWQIEEAPKLHARNYFTSIYIKDNDLYAYCTNGVEALVSKETGKFLKTELIK